MQNIEGCKSRKWNIKKLRRKDEQRVLEETIENELNKIQLSNDTEER